MNPFENNGDPIRKVTNTLRRCVVFPQGKFNPLSNFHTYAVPSKFCVYVISDGDVREALKRLKPPISVNG